MFLSFAIPPYPPPPLPPLYPIHQISRPPLHLPHPTQKKEQKNKKKHTHGFAYLPRLLLNGLEAYFIRAQWQSIQRRGTGGFLAGPPFPPPGSARLTPPRRSLLIFFFYGTVGTMFC